MIKVLNLLREQIGKFLIALSLILLGGFMLRSYLEPEHPSTLRLGYSFFGSIDEIDPNRILSIYQSNIIENLYSRLVEYNNAGQIVCGLCSSFKIEENMIIFFFKNPSKTIDGYAVDAISAKTSLDRIINSETNTHGSLKSYLDTGSGDPIEVHDSSLLIKVLKAEWTAFVINLLASMDFSIVPRESLDLKIGKVIDYKNTSGAYYVESSDNQGHIQLKANSNHKNFSYKMPLRVHFVPIFPGSANDAFKKDEIDMIDPTYYAYKGDVEEIIKNLQNARLHQTLNIGLTNLVFSSQAMKSTSTDDRIAAALVIKEIFLKKAPEIFGAEVTDQFFNPLGKDS